MANKATMWIEDSDLDFSKRDPRDYTPKVNWLDEDRVLHKDGVGKEIPRKGGEAQGRRKDPADKVMSKENRSGKQDGFSMC
jgi:hypothetical protein